MFSHVVSWGEWHANEPRAVLGAGPYHDTSEEGKFYAVVLESTQTSGGQGQVQVQPEVNMQTP